MKNEQGPTVSPCGRCDSCLSIQSATSLDVIEMDAASNNSVDDIRELRESVAYAPVSGRRKVYILDEAHMLSTAAWNAFLKTLEEPPPNTVFVLATTEAQKVPATVVDRCHRFDFHRPTVEQIASVVARAASAEQIEIPPQAITAIARAATGSFRDALGTLEQLTTYSGQSIVLEDVLAVLGVVDSELLAEVFDAVTSGDTRRVLLAVAGGVRQGRDPGAFASELEVRARELLVVQTLGEVPAELSLSPELDARLATQAQAMPGPMLVRLLELLAAAMEAIRAGGDSRTQLELALVKAARPEVDSSMAALLARIERLEGNGVGAHPLAPAPSPPPQPPQSAQPQPQPQPPDHPDVVPRAVEVSPAAGLALAVDAPEVEPQDPPSVDARPIEGSPGTADLDSICALWPAVVDLIRAENAMIAALIAESTPVSLEGSELVLAFASSAAFLKKKAEDPANRAIVTGALAQVCGVRLQPSYELREDGAEQSAQRPDPGRQDLVERLIAEFEAEELPSDPGAS
ncbi:MAG: DNA polymerase III subunit gamma/tau [Solirubrobacteraceae bacterium]